MESNEPTRPHAVVTGSLVFDAAGKQAHIVASEELRNGATQVIMQGPHGKQLRLSRQLLTLREDGSYLVPFAFSAIEEAASVGQERYVIPVIQEELHIGKRMIDTGRGIRVHRKIVERTEVVDEPLRQDELELTRVPVGRAVDPDDLPEPRQEGDTFIVPVLEEVLVIQRQWRLKEELHIARRKHEVHAPQTVILKSQEVSVEHFDEKPESRGTTPLANNPKQDTNNPGKPAR